MTIIKLLIIPLFLTSYLNIFEDNEQRGKNWQRTRQRWKPFKFKNDQHGKL